MEWWTEIRRKVLVEGVSKRRVVREYGIDWETLEKILTHSTPPGYRMKKERPKPKIGPYLERIRQIVEEDKAAPKKQRGIRPSGSSSASGARGMRGGYTQVKEAVRTIERTTREVFVPPVHRPGEAQADFGHALIRARHRAVSDPAGAVAKDELPSGGAGAPEAGEVVGHGCLCLWRPSARGRRPMSTTQPTLLLEHHLKSAAPADDAEGIRQAL